MFDNMRRQRDLDRVQRSGAVQNRPSASGSMVRHQSAANLQRTMREQQEYAELERDMDAFFQGDGPVGASLPTSSIRPAGGGGMRERRSSMKGAGGRQNRGRRATIIEPSRRTSISESPPATEKRSELVATADGMQMRTVEVPAGSTAPPVALPQDFPPGGSPLGSRGRLSSALSTTSTASPSGHRLDPNGGGNNISSASQQQQQQRNEWWQVKAMSGHHGEEESSNLVDVIQDHLSSYDENLYYACKEYVALHALFHKQQKRGGSAMEHLPFRYQLLQMWIAPLSSRMGLMYFALQCTLVLATVAQLMIESSPSYNPEVNPQYRTIWMGVEIPIATIFFLDLVAYFALLPPFPNEFCRDSRRTFFFRYETWIDIFTMLPTALMFVEDFWPPAKQLDALKALRVLRFTRVLRQLHSVDQLAYTLEQCLEPLLGPVVLLCGLIYALSAAIYYAEVGEYNPEKGFFEIEDCECESSSQRAIDPTFPCPPRKSEFISIPHTMWFTIVTMTTVGYGDMVPVCSTGKLLASVTALLGNILIAMPIAIVGTYYTNISMQNRTRIVQTRKRRAGATNSSSSGSPDEQHAIEKEREMEELRNAGGGADEGEFQKIPPHHTEAKATTSREPMEGERWYSEQKLTPGSRLASILADLELTFDLLKPPGAVLHFLNDYTKKEFEGLVAQLNTNEGLVTMVNTFAQVRGQVSMDLLSAPESASTIPKSLSLSKPIPFLIRTGCQLDGGGVHHDGGISTTGHTIDTFSTLGGGSHFNDQSILSFCTDTAAAAGFPSSVLKGYWDHTNHSVSVSPIFPAKVSRNGEMLQYGTITRLLVGDVISINSSTLDADSEKAIYDLDSSMNHPHHAGSRRRGGGQQFAVWSEETQAACQRMIKFQFLRSQSSAAGSAVNAASGGLSGNVHIDRLVEKEVAQMQYREQAKKKQQERVRLEGLGSGPDGGDQLDPLGLGLSLSPKRNDSRALGNAKSPEEGVAGSQQLGSEDRPGAGMISLQPLTKGPPKSSTQFHQYAQTYASAGAKQDIEAMHFADL